MSSISYTGTAHLPGVEEEVDITATIDEESNSVSIMLDREVGGSKVWMGGAVVMNQRLKYSEITFHTTDLPLETIDLVWKFNASKLDNSLAAVIVPQANKLRVSDEKGFILNK